MNTDCVCGHFKHYHFSDGECRVKGCKCERYVEDKPIIDPPKVGIGCGSCMGGGCPECEPGGTWNPIEPTEKQKKAAERKRIKELRSKMVHDLMDCPDMRGPVALDDVAKWMVKQGWTKR